jgi:uncharacterized membrane protein YhaH (DUF805 family)
MGPIEAISNIFSKTFVFSGRSPRNEYWWYCAFLLIILIIFLIVTFSMLFKLSPKELEEWKEFIKNPSISPKIIILFILSSPLIIQCLALTSRRLHDIGHSGWWQILFCIPMINDLFFCWWPLSFCKLPIYCLFIYLCLIKGSEDGDNQYGSPYNSLYDDTESTQNYINSLRKTKNTPQNTGTDIGHVKSKSHPEFKSLFGNKK